jgi:site-specific DNA recombinase
MVKAITNKKVVGYVRVSSEIQVDNTSIANQIQKLKEYAKLYDYELTKVFTDNARTGSIVEHRQAYNEMMEYIKNPNNGIGVVICFKCDRIHRKLKNLLTMIEELELLNIGFVSITENFDTSTSQGMLFLQMIGSFAEFERRTINERTKSGRIRKALDGRFAGGGIAFSYSLKDDRFEINEDEAKIVVQIFKDKASGDSLQRIADTLNNKGIKNSRVTSWHRQGIDYILKNPTYTGEFKYNGMTENNNICYKIPKIISKQLFGKVNKKTA